MWEPIATDLTFEADASGTVLRISKGADHGLCNQLLSLNVGNWNPAVGGIPLARGGMTLSLALADLNNYVRDAGTIGVTTWRGAVFTDPNTKGVPETVVELYCDGDEP